MNEEQDKTLKSISKDLVYCLIGGALILLNLIGIDSHGDLRHRDTKNRLDNITKKVDALTSIRLENVLAGPAFEKFYEIDGKRAYLEIDGKPVEQYFSGEVERK